jgi:hypothetical protein
MFLPHTLQNVLWRFIPAPSNNYIKASVSINVPNRQPFTWGTINHTLPPGRAWVSLPDHDMISVCPLRARHNFEMSISIDITHLNVMRTGTSDDMVPPHIRRWIPRWTRILVPLQPVVRIPLRDQNIKVAVPVHIGQLGIGTPLARRCDNVPIPVWTIVPDQGPPVAASHHDINETISVNISNGFDVWILRGFRVNDQMLKWDRLKIVHRRIRLLV